MVSEGSGRRSTREICLESMGGVELELKVLEEYTNCGTDAVVWDAGLVLSNYLVHAVHDSRRLSFKGKTVLDVGSGTGIVGLTAAAMGAEKVFLTDLPTVIPMLKKNVEQNREAIETHRRRHFPWIGGESLDSVLECFPLTWGKREDMETIEKVLRNKGDTNGEDQRESETAGITDIGDRDKMIQFDYILLGDCVFDLEVTEALVETLKQLVHHTDASVICSHEIREPKANADAEKLFFDFLSKNEFSYTRLKNNELHPEMHSEDIAVHKIWHNVEIDN